MGLGQQIGRELPQGLLETWQCDIKSVLSFGALLGAKSSFTVSTKTSF